MFINPKLNGALTFKQFPKIAKPVAPTKAIKKPMAADVPIATFIGQPNILNIGVLNTPPPIPIGADRNPERKPQIIL